MRIQNTAEHLKRATSLLNESENMISQSMESPTQPMRVSSAPSTVDIQDLTQQIAKLKEQLEAFARMQALQQTIAQSQNAVSADINEIPQAPPLNSVCSMNEVPIAPPLVAVNEIPIAPPLTPTVNEFRQACPLITNEPPFGSAVEIPQAPPLLLVESPTARRPTKRVKASRSPKLGEPTHRGESTKSHCKILLYLSNCSV